MVNPQVESEPGRPQSESKPMTRRLAHRVDWPGVIAATAPVVVLGGVATAYGFLEGKGNHPSLKLGGAFLVAGLAAISVLFGRSVLLRDGRAPREIRRAVVTGRDRRDIARVSLAFLSVAAALIHFAVIEQHFTEYWLYGAFFVAVGVFELTWALLVLAAPSRLLYWQASWSTRSRSPPTSSPGPLDCWSAPRPTRPRRSASGTSRRPPSNWCWSSDHCCC